jgi:hypothetical protein
MDLINKTICCQMGMGDLLLIKQYSLTKNISFNKMFINKTLLGHRLNINNYKLFLRRFVTRLFDGCKLEFVDPPRQMVDIWDIIRNIKKYNLYPIYNFNLIYTNNYLLSNPYIIIHTKCRLDIASMDLFLKDINKFDDFCNTFKCNCNIILFGEKNAEKNLEQSVLNIQTVYPYLVKLSKNNNVIDITSDLISSSNDLNNFENEVHIIAKAQSNITLGIGGPFVISHTFSESNYCFISSLVYPLPEYYTPSLYRDLDLFLNDIKIKYSR